MAKCKPAPSPSLSELLSLLEIKQALTKHCTSLKSIVDLMRADKPAAAMARLEGAVAALEQTLRLWEGGWRASCAIHGEPTTHWQPIDESTPMDGSES